MNRNRFPRVINLAIDAIADAPMSPIGRVAAARIGKPAPRGSVASTVFADKPVRILIAPVNYSGQGREWARSLESADERISARNMAIDVPGGFAFHADVVVPVSTYHNDVDWQQREFNAARSATHVLVEAEEPPFGRLLGRSVVAQSRALLDAGVDVAFLGHGTDVRLPSRHIAENEWSYYADPSVYTPRAETLAARNIAVIRDSGRPVFVSTPDLLIDLPEATWCPVVVEPERWRSTRVARDMSTPLRVAHAPSVAAAKGTHLVMPALERLVSAGIVELEIVSGVPSGEMPAVFARADVVLDQFRAGSYGVAACESMASGCLAVGNVSPRVRAEVAARTGLALPIIQADPLTIEEVLINLAREPHLDDRREASIVFVRTVHDGRMSARSLIDNWISPFRGDHQNGAPHAPVG